jgi:hypothetical protein
VNHQVQLPVPLDYKGIRIEVGYRAPVAAVLIDADSARS